jgi:hypothetical protein
MRTITAVAMLLLAAGAALGDEDLERRERAVDKHLLRVQQERFEARARGDDAATLRRLDREFKRTETRRRAVLKEEQAAED